MFHANLWRPDWEWSLANLHAAKSSRWHKSNLVLDWNICAALSVALNLSSQLWRRSLIWEWAFVVRRRIQIQKRCLKLRRYDRKHCSRSRANHSLPATVFWIAGYQMSVFQSNHYVIEVLCSLLVGNFPHRFNHERAWYFDAGRFAILQSFVMRTVLF